MGIAIKVPGVNWSQKNIGVVTPSSTLPISAISINGENSVLGAGQYSVTLFPTFTTQRDVTWSITSGGEYASIDQDGVVSALSGANQNDVVIRAESVQNPSIYAEKTIVVSFGSIVYHDYLQSDGNAYIVAPFFLNKWGVKVIVRGTLSGNNGYLFGCRYSTSSTQARMGAYQNGTGYVAALVGTKGFSSLNFQKESQDTIYRWEFQCATDSSSTDGSVTCYDDSTSVQKGQVTGAKMLMSGYISIFTLGYGASGDEFTDNPSNHGAVKFYGLQIFENNVLIADYKPCEVSGVPAIHDLVTGDFYYNAADSGLSAGDD